MEITVKSLSSAVLAFDNDYDDHHHHRTDSITDRPTEDGKKRLVFLMDA